MSTNINPADASVRQYNNFSDAPLLPDWDDEDSTIGRHVKKLSQQCLDAYRVNPSLVREHANIERATAQGGYGRRQIYELVQNGADALLDHPGGQIYVLLTQNALYCANEGQPISEDGVDAILSSHVSMKRGSEIGRFGLGFKSVLGVTNSPQFYSRSGSFGFNGDDAAHSIRAVVPTAARVPALRVAKTLDPADAAASDPHLKELMSWATTVVKLPWVAEGADWLQEDIDDFPAEFLLFCPHVGSLILEDMTRQLKREIILHKLGDQIRIQEGEQTAYWKVFHTEHTPSETARKDAGELADRNRLPLAWAVPVQGGRNERGKFWAFFPTEYLTTLSGIINAPWKTNEDRQNLLTGAFNAELLDTVAELVVRHLPDLVEDSEPGRIIDLLPARAQDGKNWADIHLSNSIYKCAAGAPSVPNQTTRLQIPNRLDMAPAGLPREALLIWSGLQTRPVTWCHISVETRERRPRVERILSLAGQYPATLQQWLESLLVSKSVEASLAAIKIAAVIVRTTPQQKSQLESAKIVLTANGALVPAIPGTLFIASEPESQMPNLLLVHPDIAADPSGRESLEVLGIYPVEASSELESLLARVPAARMSNHQWDRMWLLVRSVNVDRAIELLNKYMENGRKTKVRTLAGTYQNFEQTLLPGAIVPPDGSRDSSITINIEYHRVELPILSALGAVSVPEPDRKVPPHILATYRSALVKKYLTSLGNAPARPRDEYLVLDRDRSSGPIEPIYALSDEGRVRFTEALLLAGTDEDPYTLRHKTKPDAYPIQSFEPPYLWVIRQEGRLRTSRGYRQPHQCVGSALRAFASVLPVADCSDEIARRLNLPMSLEHLSAAHWREVLQVIEQTSDENVIGFFYSAAARHISVPSRIRCIVGVDHKYRRPTDVTVASQPAEQEALIQLKKPFIFVATNEAAETLVSHWGLIPASHSVKIETYVEPSGTAVPMADKFPGLSARLGENDYDLDLIPCRSLRTEILTDNGKHGEEQDLIREGQIIYFADCLGNDKLLDRLSVLLDVFLSHTERTDILEHQVLTERRERFFAIRTQSSLPEKLLAAVGVEAISRRLPVGVLQIVDGNPQYLPDVTVAEMALAVYGVETLREFRDDLEHNGLEPPRMWNGSHAARVFVKRLGFPKEFAGFEQSRRVPLWTVDGPPDLPALHDFQKQITGEIRQLVRSDSGKRGLLSLPTGAGKTRVAVEALVDAVKAGELTGPILWVAQSDELCEQAVQTWSYVWRSLGPQRLLRINRLWASNEADSFEADVQVVVATIQKLQGCFTDPLYEWLSKATAVVIDEAHGSVGPSYTALLQWLGLGRGNDRCPLIGLTATPFRGGEEETKRLVARYGGKRLDVGALGGDPYGRLQELGVLAKVGHRLLAGTNIDLNDKELAELKRTRLFPASANERIGKDIDRNMMILNSIKELPSDWPVLLFATSVDHAQTMAALLSFDGIPAAAVSSYTESGARRHYIESFRSGDIRVLTNYAVLTTGFDAPAVRAIFVTRPTFSPVLYQQMIGRGLRGPKNGGKEHCLIVNVQDNIHRYGEELAFRQFEYLWSNQ